ncbi:glutaredoxin family protein [Micrococcus lylae]|uniref:Glutaredoxin family protein n=1 Tax=Micrococcus lylae TaxID=1273 RepID=A0ABY2JWL7_9MICC|nr:glutaredoxin family protein [Micrococcus lylae]TFH97828.1 glutaredoxin family protein [Micrococcus lylae]
MTARTTHNPHGRTIGAGRTIVLHTTPTCQQCTATKRFLDNRNVRYDVIDLTQDRDAHVFVTKLGYTSAPVIVIFNEDGEPVQDWSGFRPDLISAMFPLHAEAVQA